jgi:hypothetical protein
MTGPTAADARVTDLDPDAGWAAQETWVWRRTLAGEIADFDVLYGTKPQPGAGDPAWSSIEQPRRLSAKFLSDVLTVKRFTDAVPCHGVRINGACVAEQLAFDDLEVQRPLTLVRTRFEGGVSFKRARFGARLSLQDSYLASALDLTRCSIKQTLILERATLDGDVNLLYANVEGQLDATGCTVRGSMSMNSAAMGEDVVLSAARFEGPIDMRAAKVGRQVRCSSSTFIKTVDLDGIEIGTDLVVDEGSTFRGELTLRGGSIGGQVTFDGCIALGPLTMDGVDVAQDVFLDHSLFLDEVAIQGSSVAGQLTTSGSTFSGGFDVDGIDVAQDIHFDEQTTFLGRVLARGAKVTGDLNAPRAAFASTVTLDGTSVGQNVSFADAWFGASSSMHGATIGGQLTLDRATFTRRLDLGAIKVTRGIVLRHKATFHDEVLLRGASVDGTIDAEGAIFRGPLDMERLKTGGSLLLRGAQIRGAVNGFFASIGASVDVSDSDVHRDVDLSGTNVAADLRLGSDKHKPTRWAPTARLIVRNAHVGAIQDGLDERGAQGAGWPPALELEGFRYDHLGGLQGEGASNMGNRPAAWFVQWVERHTSESPQPYQYLASVLREAGRLQPADRVLYAARERERRAAWNARKPFAWVGRSLLKVTIGYGLGAGYFLALVWALGFVVVGTIVLTHDPDLQKNGLAWCIGASLDAILPVIELNKKHGEVIDAALRGWQLWYFYLHRVAGFVLGSFVVAGLSGLTQAS